MPPRPHTHLPSFSMFFPFRNQEQWAEFPLGRSLLGFGSRANGAVPCIGPQQGWPTGHFRHIEVIDALLVRQGQESPSCQPGVLGAQILLAPGCSSLIKTAQLQTFLSFRSLEKTLFSWLHGLFSFSHPDPPHSSSLSGL